MGNGRGDKATAMVNVSRFKCELFDPQWRSNHSALSANFHFNVAKDDNIAEIDCNNRMRIQNARYLGLGSGGEDRLLIYFSFLRRQHVYSGIIWRTCNDG